jgi:tRNA G10  N-methylase Trm11
MQIPKREVVLQRNQKEASPTTVERFRFSNDGFDRLTHYLFRYPAKFHPPVARALIEEYTEPGDHVLDPFCGSGTLLVEAAIVSRHATGTDIDPVAVFVSKVKTHRFNTSHLSKSCDKLVSRLRALRRPKGEYVERQFTDLSEQKFYETIDERDLWVPPIPNLFHWFRRYVIIDLACIHHEVEHLDVPNTHKDFLRLCFCSIIRNASNADPVPVSGLEVTAHMRRKDAEGRLIDPFDLFEKAIRDSLVAATEFREKSHAGLQVRAFQADATCLSSRVRSPIDAVITSPPYNNAVNYYRRHKLEMYWLGLTKGRKERLALLQHYIGRSKVAARHPFVASEEITTPLASEWELKLRQKSPKRAHAFKHYMVSMGKAIGELADVLPPGKLAVFVVGHSHWKDQEIPTTDLLLELCGDFFQLEEHLWYPLRNRYMSYQRHNAASIDKEYVLVLRRTTRQSRSGTLGGCL